MPETAPSCERMHLQERHAIELAKLIGRCELLEQELERVLARLDYMRSRMSELAREMAVGV